MAHKLLKRWQLPPRTVTTSKQLSKIIAYFSLVTAVSCVSVRLYSTGTDAGPEVDPEVSLREDKMGVKLAPTIPPNARKECSVTPRTGEEVRRALVERGSELEDAIECLQSQIRRARYQLRQINKQLSEVRNAETQDE